MTVTPQRPENRHDGHWIVTDAAVTLVLLLALTAAAACWFYNSLTFFGEQLHPADYQQMGTGLATCAALVGVCGGASLRLLSCSRWVWVGGALVFVLVGVGAVLGFAAVDGASPDRSIDPQPADIAGSVWAMVLLDLPLVVLLLVALVRARRSHGPR